MASIACSESPGFLSQGPRRLGVVSAASLLVLSGLFAFQSCSARAERPSSPILARVSDDQGATQFTALAGGIVQEARLAHPVDAAFGVLFEEERTRRRKRRRKPPPTVAPMIAEAIPGGGAELAGLRPGDRITAIDRAPVESVADFRRLIGARHAGDTVRVEVARRAERIIHDVHLVGGRDAVVRVIDRAEFPRHVDSLWTGLEVVQLDAATRERVFQRDAPGLIVTAVIDGTPGYEAGLRPGDRLVSVDGVETTTIDAWRRQLRGFDEGRSVPFRAESSTGPTEGTISLRLIGRRKFADVPILFRYAKGVDGTSVHFGSVLFDYETTYRSTRSREPVKDVEFACLLGLVRWRETEAKRQLRLFWLLPISF